MKKIYLIVILAVVCHNYLVAQIVGKQFAYQQFENLIGGTWTYESKWPDGKPFKQEYVLEWSLEKQLIKTKTYGTIDSETGQHGLRNEGIRVWDNQSNQMKFYEFDVFGGIVEGQILFEKGMIFYQYEYELEGKIELFRDTWKYIDDNTYEYSVSMKSGNSWNILMTNQLKREVE